MNQLVTRRRHWPRAWGLVVVLILAGAPSASALIIDGVSAPGSIFRPKDSVLYLFDVTVTATIEAGDVLGGFVDMFYKDSFNGFGIGSVPWVDGFRFTIAPGFMVGQKLSATVSLAAGCHTGLDGTGMPIAGGSGIFGPQGAGATTGEDPVMLGEFMFPDLGPLDPFGVPVGVWFGNNRAECVEAGAEATNDPPEPMPNKSPGGIPGGPRPSLPKEGPFTALSVPEPSAALLWLVGVGAVAVRRQRSQ